MNLLQGRLRQNLEQFTTDASDTNNQHRKSLKVDCFGIDGSVDFAADHLENKLLEVLKLIFLKYWSHIIPTNNFIFIQE